LSAVGLMGGTADALTDVAVPRGLIRVRTDGDPPERHEFHIWAVPGKPHGVRSSARTRPGSRSR
jgi:hypothetical protein